MSREILFKAKRKNWRELPKDEWWVEGLPFIQDLDGMEQVCIAHHSISANDYSEICGENKNWFQIDPETLCQYTGMNDKNGKRVWENDIVSCEHEKYPEDNPLEVDLFFPELIKYRRNYAVEFINNGNKYGYRLRNKSIHFMLTGNVIYNHEIKVLGNVFDNSELLQEV